MAEGNETSVLTGWFAEVFLKEVVFLEGSSRCWVTFDPVSPFKQTDESSRWTVFRRKKIELDTSEFLSEKENEDNDVVVAQLVRANRRFVINGFVGNDELIKLKQTHAKLRICVKDGSNNILRMDVV